LWAVTFAISAWVAALLGSVLVAVVGWMPGWIGSGLVTGSWGLALPALSVYIGPAYLDVTVDLTGSFTLDTSDIPGAPPSTTLDYLVTQSNKDKWNFLVGFNWDLTKAWSVQAESSAGGSRQGFVGSVTWRF